MLPTNAEYCMTRHHAFTFCFLPKRCSLHKWSHLSTIKSVCILGEADLILTAMDKYVYIYIYIYMHLSNIQYGNNHNGLTPLHPTLGPHRGHEGKEMGWGRVHPFWVYFHIEYRI